MRAQIAASGDTHLHLHPRSNKEPVLLVMVVVVMVVVRGAELAGNALFLTFLL